VAPQPVDYFPPTAEPKAGELREFIDSIDPSDVCSLASQYNYLKPCKIFQKSAHGSYNVCFFVEFKDGVIWVVRFILMYFVYNIWDEVQSEVTSIRQAISNLVT
jgi:hypothetical protein